MRAYAAGRGVTNVPTAARGPNVYGIASRPLYIVEVGVFNTTTTAATAAAARATGAGTQAGAVTEISEDSEITPAATAFTSQSADATIAGVATQASLGAAIGAGVIWTFGGKGLRIPAGTANGCVLTCPSGTGQFEDFYFVWEE
jgi:hypothetical protein